LRRPQRAIKPALFLLGLVPLGLHIWRATHDDLGADPIRKTELFTGDWTLRFLLITLAVTPLRRLTGWNELVKYRRMLGLFAFFYACLHLTTYIALDHFFNFADIGKDIAKHLWVTVGMAGFLMLLPLAVTSTKGWIRRLGGRRWQRLHRLAYVAATAGVVHFYWLVKKDVTQPLIYATILAVLLGSRIAVRLKARAARPSADAGRPGRRVVGVEAD
jgi:sulfoxide reductase heme-binding subunit YedZ